MKDLFGSDPIMALSWKQPYASLMLLGKIETRTWNTNYRGLVLICASQGFYSESQIMAISGEVQTQHAFVALLQNGIKEERGKAIAIGRLVDCRPMNRMDEDKCFVKYRTPWQVKKEMKDGSIKMVTKKLYCHIYEDVKPIKPFEWKGCQGWKKVDDEIIKKIIFI